MPDVNAGWQWVVDMCNDPTVGYSQSSRNAGKDAYGNTYYDCSSLMNYACIQMGFETPSYAPYYNPWCTWDMPNELARLGWHQIGTGDYCLPGDIGVNPDTHTEMCFSEGYMGNAIWMGAHTNSAPWDGQVSIGSSDGNTNWAKSYGYWQQIWRYEDGGTGGEPQAKFSFAVCAAICGNWYQESGCNPGIWEGLVVRPWTWTWNGDNTGGYGLGQWTSTGGDSHGRLYQLHEFLSSNGYDDDSGDGQLAFLIQENYWYTVVGPYNSLTEFLNSDSDDVDYMTECFLRNWEGINDGTLGKRQEGAEKIYTYLQEHWTDDVKWEAYNNWTSDSTWYNNSICIYQWLNINVAGGSNSGTGGGTTSGSSGGTAVTQEGNDDTNSDWYSLFEMMMGLSGNKDAATEALRILKQRK